MAVSTGLRAIQGGRRRVLVLEVRAFEDAGNGLRDSLRALEPRRGTEVRRVPPGTARALLSVVMLTLLRMLKRHRRATLTALAESSGRGVADVRGHLALLERLGVVRLRETGGRGGPITPELRYDAIELKLGF